jgi:acetyl-CoA carboxylase biotin carboxyl carrier protein
LDLKEIKQIVDLMKRAGLCEFEIEEKDFKLRLCRESTAPAVAMAPAPAMPMAYPAPAPAAPAAPVPAREDPAKIIKSPMVGTFYTAPSPDSPVFAKVGDRVGPDSVVCIIEAMKVMNEIKAEVSGEIAEICLNNGDSVEFGQPLFKLK